MKFRILIPAILIFSLASTAYADEITGTLTAGGGATVATSSGSSLSGTVSAPTATSSSGSSLSGTVSAPSSTGSLSGNVATSSASSLSGTVSSPPSSSAASAATGGGGGGNGPPVGLIGGGGSSPGEAIIPTGASTPGEVLGASTGPTITSPAEPAIPGTPNTGAGGNAPQNIFTLLASGLVALLSGLYLMMRKVRIG